MLSMVGVITLLNLEALFRRVDSCLTLFQNFIAKFNRRQTKKVNHALMQEAHCTQSNEI